MLFVSIILIVMATISGYIHYFDIKKNMEMSQKDYMSQINNFYELRQELLNKHYGNRSLVHVDSHGVQSAIFAKDSKRIVELSVYRWEMLKKENPFLLGLRFYDEKKQLIAYLGQEPEPHEIKLDEELSDEVDFGFFSSISYSAYHIRIPIYKEGVFICTMEFIISPEYFLSRIKNYLSLQGYILYNTDQAPDINAFFAGYKLDDGSILKIENITYMTYIVRIKDKFNGKSLASLLFLQDITEQQKNLSNTIYKEFFMAIIVIIILLIILNYGFNILIKRLEESEANLLKLNYTLESRVREESKQRLQSEKLLIQQSRLASMGEMIGNIAHQWRQPLTELGATLFNLYMLWSKQKLTGELFDESMDHCEKIIIHMSKTIDDFRNFFATTDEKEHYVVNDAIKSAIELVSAALKNHYIDLVFYEKDRYELEGSPRQFAQVILNILVNAKDTLLDRAIAKPRIKISLYSENEHIVIDIEDNGGGILMDPIEHIFEPYFTTKHAKKGTGIGLYMSKMIIEENTNGSLEAFNTSEGACFKITLRTFGSV
ncbi:histidine kinase [Sulfurospirillum barnesii SES-3]|uniref:histidine kinase n=2 Tax=Sulfurospirillum barnesii TaxID=44674 RepID=I3XXI0_SULBS|nr:histidine kinase [Sulfurospirillum barnesii SES-3]